jgi:hypothetical protein
MSTSISHKEFLKLKAEKQDLPEQEPVIEGNRYKLSNFDLIKILKIDNKNDKIHYFNFTQQCNVYARLKTFRYKNEA